MGRQKKSPELLDNIDAEAIKDIMSDPDVKNHIENLTATAPPAMGTEGWTEYVLSQLRPNEIIDGAPKVEGLRRICSEVLGPIISNTVSIGQVPNPQNHYCATMLCTVIVATDEGRLDVTEIGDADKRNTPHPFNLHLSSTAASRAEGKALRKLLRLTGLVVAEEIAPEGAQAAEVEESTPFACECITATQLTLLDKLCSENNVNVSKYLNSGKKQYANLSEVTRQTAAEAIEYLHTWAVDEDKIPPGVKGYDKDWRKTLKN